MVREETLVGGSGSTEAAATLRVGRSRADQRFVWFLVVATLCQLAFNVFHVGGRRPGLFGVAFICITIWFALRTYVQLTTFTANQIEHRTMLGVCRVVESGKYVVYESRGSSIMILGDDLAGKSIQIRIMASDADLDEVTNFLKEKVGVSAKSC